MSGTRKRKRRRRNKRERARHTSPRILTPSCASCIHPLSTNSLAVIGFSGVELNRPCCTQNAILSKLTGAHVFPVLQTHNPTRSYTQQHIPRQYVSIRQTMFRVGVWRKNALIEKPPLREQLRNRRLSTLESRFWLAVPRACFLAFMSSSGGLTET